MPHEADLVPRVSRRCGTGRAPRESWPLEMEAAGHLRSSVKRAVLAARCGGESQDAVINLHVTQPRSFGSRSNNPSPARRATPVCRQSIMLCTSIPASSRCPCRRCRPRRSRPSRGSSHSPWNLWMQLPASPLVSGGGGEMSGVRSGARSRARSGAASGPGSGPIRRFGADVQGIDCPILRPSGSDGPMSEGVPVSAPTYGASVPVSLVLPASLDPDEPPPPPRSAAACHLATVRRRCPRFRRRARASAAAPAVAPPVPAPPLAPPVDPPLPAAAAGACGSTAGAHSYPAAALGSAVSTTCPGSSAT